MVKVRSHKRSGTSGVSSHERNMKPVMKNKFSSPIKKTEPFLDTIFKQGQIRRISSESDLFDDQGNNVSGDKVKLLTLQDKTVDIFNIKTRRVTRNFPIALLSAFRYPEDEIK